MPLAVATAAAVWLPEPNATAPALPATLLAPRAIAVAALALATGPTATLSVPVAVLSAKVELAWKYLMPAPLASAYKTLTVLFVVERPVDEEVESELMPDDAEVESEETLLLVVDRPDDAEVESEPT